VCVWVGLTKLWMRDINSLIRVLVLGANPPHLKKRDSSFVESKLLSKPQKRRHFRLVLILIMTKRLLLIKSHLTSRISLSYLSLSKANLPIAHSS